MSLIKNTSEIIDYLPISESMETDSFMPFVSDAERDFLIPAIGQELFDILDEAYNDTPTPSLTSIQQELLEKCQAVLAPYAFMLWIPSGQLLISDAGIRIANTDTHKTAFQWQIDQLADSLLKKSGSAMDDLLLFLESNKDDFTAWTDSDSYTELKDCFIQTTAKFTELYTLLGGSHRNFMAIRSCMKKVQDFVIQSEIGSDFYDELKTQMVGDSVTPENEKAIKYIQKALAPLTIAKALTELVVSIDKRGVLVFNNVGSSLVSNPSGPANDNQILKLEKAAKSDGDSYLRMLKEFLKSNIDDYATYANSDAYDSDTTDHSFKNDSESGTFSFT